MNKQEKTLLLQVILEDIRGNWGFGLEERVDKALELAEDLELPVFIDSIEEYKKACEQGCDDGRYFKCSYECGGYEGMECLHDLTKTVSDKSDEFKNSLDILTYPDCRFDDWEDYNEGV